MRGRTHLFIPDTQVKPGVPLDHLDWIGRYILTRKPDVIIMAGDWYDLPSLSAWDRGKAEFEGRRFKADVEAGHAALDRMEAPINEHNARKQRHKAKQYKPRKVVTWGNHEHRANRAASEHPELQGFVGTHLFDEYWQERGWETHDYTEVVDIDGVWYSHLFLNENTGRAIGSKASTMLPQIGHSFTQGHRQAYDLATRYVGKRMHRGLIAGACYLHDEDYKGPKRDNSERSGNHHWRGIVVKHEVRDGEYCVMEVTLDYLCRRYEGCSLDDFMGERAAA